MDSFKHEHSYSTDLKNQKLKYFYSLKKKSSQNTFFFLLKNYSHQVDLASLLSRDVSVLYQMCSQNRVQTGWPSPGNPIPHIPVQWAHSGARLAVSLHRNGHTRPIPIHYITSLFQDVHCYFKPRVTDRCRGVSPTSAFTQTHVERQPAGTRSMPEDLRRAPPLANSFHWEHY